jgi:hypothetical protein
MSLLGKAIGRQATDDMTYGGGPRDKVVQDMFMMTRDAGSKVDGRVAGRLLARRLGIGMGGPGKLESRNVISEKVWHKGAQAQEPLRRTPHAW